MGIKHRRVSALLGDGWARPQKSTRLSPGDVQIWRLDLTCTEGQGWVEAGWDLLSAEETARAQRMRAGTSRDEQVASRAALRSLLAIELDCKPSEVRFRIGEHGKPSLPHGDLAFNVAHSRGMVLIALSLAGPVGIDVEDSARPVEALDVARTAFHPDEVLLLQSTIKAQQPAVFYRCWTRKEAIAKADGRGLTLPMSSFSVVRQGEKCLDRKDIHSDQQILGSCGEFTDDVTVWGVYDKNYYLLDLLPGGRFCAALALSQRICSIAEYDVNPVRDLK